MLNFKLLPLWLCILGASAGSPIPPEYSEKITVFHVNPIIYGAAPVNMDTGNDLGDMYFDLRSVCTPIECADPSSATARDCDNAEVVSPDLVINKLILEVDNRKYGEYGRCNICVNGTDHHGNNSCTNGAYWCSCGYNTPSQCGPDVGRENLTEHYAGRSCSSRDPNWECWRTHVAKRTGGLWYSTTSDGWCDRPGFDPNTDTCSWRVHQAVKRVNKTCSDNSIYSHVEKVDQTTGQGCFAKCGHGKVGPQRNISDPCWISCFYDTTLGPNSGTPSWNATTGGIFRAEMKAMWNQPFLPEAEGGCPSLPF